MWLETTAGALCRLVQASTILAATAAVGVAAAEPLPTPEAFSLAVAHSLVEKRFSDVTALFDAKLASVLPEAALAKAWQQTTEPMGKLLKTGTPTAQQFGVHMIATVPLIYERGPVNLVVTQDGGKIAGIFLRPGDPNAR